MRQKVTISVNNSAYKVFKEIKSRRGLTLSGLVDNLIADIIVDELKVCAQRMNKKEYKEFIAFCDAEINKLRS